MGCLCFTTQNSKIWKIFQQNSSVRTQLTSWPLEFTRRPSKKKHFFLEFCIMFWYFDYGKSSYFQLVYIQRWTCKLFGIEKNRYFGRMLDIYIIYKMKNIWWWVKDTSIYHLLVCSHLIWSDNPDKFAHCICTLFTCLTLKKVISCLLISKKARHRLIKN